MKRSGLVVLVAALALVIAAPAEASTSAQGHARIAKKCKKKHGKKKKCKRHTPAPVVVTPPAPPPTPLALTDAEVITQVIQKAGEYCLDDPECVDYGYYYDPAPGTADCFSRSTYSWTCYGWNDEDNGADPIFTCDFR